MALRTPGDLLGSDERARGHAPQPLFFSRRPAGRHFTFAGNAPTDGGRV